ncbi:PAP fimbrial minor pilin protein precursor [Acinetobacter baumannii]|nr:PAP fimbrial minor pilin protein precursor [Acinetobacter baumannii]
MQGAIIDTACAIATESREQVIDMSVTPLADIIRDGRGRTVKFNIYLINCVLERSNPALPDWRQFQVTFDGNAEGELFGVAGDVSGVALRISDADGNIARPGIPLPLRDLVAGNHRLDFALDLIANHRPLKAGSYFSSVRFKMDYY